MEQNNLFSILNSVDSTNNYAMAMIHAGMAKHGQAWFCDSQTAGKGQREKKWYSREGKNIALSIAMQPGSLFQGRQFLFNAFIAGECHSFFKELAGNEVSVKWPNDIYWRDRKAGGILIENNTGFNKWNWAVVGIGLNINQDNFPPYLPNPVSLKQITGKEENIIALAEKLQIQVIESFNSLTSDSISKIIGKYNEMLYKKDQEVKLRSNNISFSTIVKSVNEFGQLLTKDAIDRQFNFGEVEWV